MFNKFVQLISVLLLNNKSIIFLDYYNNYNYLPISNSMLFSRSSKKLLKTIHYFNVSAVFFFNFKKKNFIFKKLFNFNLINVSFNPKFFKNKFDLNFNIPNTQLHTYIIYLLFLKVYLIIKNKNKI